MSEIVAFTGAGISKASGIPTYTERPELRELFTLARLHNNTPLFMKQYLSLMLELEHAQPNPAHTTLAMQHIPIITQNIDGLHQKAGSRQTVAIHGTYNRFYCMNPNCSYVISPFFTTHTTSMPICPRCNQGILRPDIVLYGENIKKWWQAYDLIAQAKTVLVIGTSLEVYPAAELPLMAQSRGAKIIFINNDAEERVPQLFHNGQIV